MRRFARRQVQSSIESRTKLARRRIDLHGKKLRRQALGILVAALSLVAHAANSVEVTHSSAVLRLLERCHAGVVPSQAIDQVMDLPGTRLIIGR